MIPADLSLKTIHQTSLGIIQITVNQLVQRAEYVPFGPFAWALANAIWSVLNSGAPGTWLRVKDAIPKIYPLVWSLLPPSLRSKLEAFLVDVFRKLI